MPRAVILGGTGVLGRATARRLLAAMWTVDLTGRDPSRMPADLTDAGLAPTPEDPFFAPLLDYAAEDRYLAQRARPASG